MVKIASILLLLMGTSLFKLVGQEKYFVEFVDKKGSSHSIHAPSTYLSGKAIERREKQNISITENDLPVSSTYLHEVRRLGVDILFTSKWLNGVVVENPSARQVRQLNKRPFVKEVLKIFDPDIKGTPTPEFPTYSAYTELNDSSNYYNYGSAVVQVEMVNGHHLHNLGYRGKGITIAVLDAGFYKANTLPAFDSLWANKRIVFEKDVVDTNTNIYQENSHGMLVLSVMGANIDGQMVGTAPEASYVLIRCEDTSSEQVIEEYYWAKAAEMADSIGADVINSSLGYYNYDAPYQALSYNELDGKTTPIARAANTAGLLGMLVVVSAGNEALTDWKHIITPADAHECIAVGAVNRKEELAAFSSLGPTYDGRIKPDVVALGEGTVVQTPSGEIGAVDGTSISAPIVSGFAACLWQALPHLTAKELAHIMLQSGSRSSKPNNSMGYGIPDFSKAIKLSKEM